MRIATALLTMAALLATFLTTADTSAQQRQRAGVSPSTRQPVQRSQPRTVHRAAPTPRVQQPRISQPRISQPRISQPRSTPQPSWQNPIQRSTPRVTTPRAATPRYGNPTVRSIQPSPQQVTPRSRGYTPSTRGSYSPSSRITTPRVTTPRTTSSTRVVTPSDSRSQTTTTPRRSSMDSARSVTPRYRAPSIDSSRTSTTRRAVGTAPSDSTSARLRYLGDRARSRATSGDAAAAKTRAVEVKNRLGDHYGRRLDRDLDRVKVNAPSSDGSPRLSSPRTSVPGSASRDATRARSTEARSAKIRTRYTPTLGTPARDAASPTRLERPRSTLRSRTPTLNAGERIQPRLQPRSAPRASLGSIPRSGIGAALSARRSVVSHAAWGNHYSTLSFAFGSGRYANWGCYSYPFFYCSTLPYYYQHCYSTYWGYRRSCYSGFGLGLWWWPRHSYLAGSWLCASDWSWYDDDPYDYYYQPGPSYVVIRERSEPSAVVVASAPESDDAAPSVTDLASRHLSLGDYYFREGRFGEAAESYLRALAYAPDDGALHFLVADALFAQGDYHYAAHMIAKGVDLDAELVHATTDKREFYGDRASFDKQLATLRTYLDEKPYDAASHLVIGYNLHFSADREGARRAFERVLEIDPTDPTARVFLTASVAPK